MCSEVTDRVGEGPELRKVYGTYRDHGCWAWEREVEEGTRQLNENQEKHVGNGEMSSL